MKSLTRAITSSQPASSGPRNSSGLLGARHGKARESVHSSQLEALIVHGMPVASSTSIPQA